MRARGKPRNRPVRRSLGEGGRETQSRRKRSRLEPDREAQFQTNLKALPFYQLILGVGIIVGAYAVIHYTQPRYTKDIDLWIKPSVENAAKIARAFHRFGLPLIEVTQQDFEQEGLQYVIGVPPCQIDFLTSLPGTPPFEDSWKNRSTGKEDGTPSTSWANSTSSLPKNPPLVLKTSPTWTNSAARTHKPLYGRPNKPTPPDSPSENYRFARSAPLTAKYSMPSSLPLIRNPGGSRPSFGKKRPLLYKLPEYPVPTHSPNYQLLWIWLLKKPFILGLSPIRDFRTLTPFK